MLIDAIETFEKEVKSSGDTSEFNVRTWLDIHEAAHWRCLGMPQSIDALPLTPRIITVIGAVMKAAGYRSAKNYMTAIKKLHISRGHRWDEQLAMSAHNFNLSTTRGIGPVRQSEPLSVERVSAIDIDAKLPDKSFPSVLAQCSS